MLGIVSLPLVHNLADVLCVGKDVVDQPTCVVLEATVKRLWIDGDRIELRAENRKYKPIEITAEREFRIVGKVLAIRGKSQE